MVLLNVNGLKLRPFRTERIFWSLFSTLFYFFYQGEIWLFGNKLESFKSCLSGDYIFLVINYFVFNVKDKFFYLFSFLLSLLKDLILLISTLLFIVTIYQIGINSDKKVDRFIFLYQTYKFDYFFQNYFPELFDSLDFWKLILKFTLIE